jgi:hypothetical protein
MGKCWEGEHQRRYREKPALGDMVYLLLPRWPNGG